MLDRIRNEKIRSTAKVGEISEKEMKNMWAREQWGWRCRGKEEEDQSGGGWTTSGTTCRRELSGDEVRDRVKWRRLIIRNTDPT